MVEFDPFSVRSVSLSFQIELMQNLADIFMGAVQYNEEGVFMSISDLCEVMTWKNGTNEKGQNAYDSLVKLAQVFNTFPGFSLCLNYIPTVIIGAHFHFCPH